MGESWDDINTVNRPNFRIVSHLSLIKIFVVCGEGLASLIPL